MSPEETPSSSFEVIPVIDVRLGRAVHARGGVRANYGPIRSVLYTGDDPAHLAAAFREKLGLNTLYLADLDAIEGRLANIALVERLNASGFTLWVDSGLRDASSTPVFPSGLACLRIAATETLNGLEALIAIVQIDGPDNVIFGLDLKAGQLRSAPSANWSDKEPVELVDRAVALGLRRVLILDLAKIGTGRGIGTLEFVTAIRSRYPEIRIAVGGGISGISDLLELRRCGVAAALVGSAFHDGRIGVKELETLRQS